MPNKRIRPLQLANLRSFEAVAKHLNFRAAADFLSLTQSAVTKHIQAIEHDLEVKLFERHTRQVRLTPAGELLQNAVTQGLERIDTAVNQIRQGQTKPSVSLTTFASFASMWLIPKLDLFHAKHPHIDIRVDASDTYVNLESKNTDLALRYGLYEQMPKGAIRLFDDVLTPVVSRLYPERNRLQDIESLAQCTLVEMSDSYPMQAQWQTWDGWFKTHGAKLESTPRMLHFNYYYQVVQAALTGQAVALARMPLVAESLVNGDLVEPFPSLRVASPLCYWLIAKSDALTRPEVLAFSNWLQRQARQTRIDIGQTVSPKSVLGALAKQGRTYQKGK